MLEAEIASLRTLLKRMKDEKDDPTLKEFCGLTSRGPRLRPLDAVRQASCLAPASPFAVRL